MIALGIANAPWIPARKESLRRLLSGLALPEEGVISRVFDDREPCWAWCERMMHWALETGAEHLLHLQDDVEVAPNFWPALRAMLGAVPDKVIGLQAAHTLAQRLALEGKRWYSTSDFLVGVGYVMPRAELVAFLEWRQSALRRGAIARISEDDLIGIWSWLTGRRIFHPIPTIIDHDTSIASTYGNDAHGNRRSCVTWRDGDVVGFTPEELTEKSFWQVDEPPVHLGCCYEATPHLARLWLTDPSSVPEPDPPDEPYATRWT